MALPARLLRPIVSGDPDARRYIEAVQRADGNTLEPGVRKAITDFVVGCKSDGIWSAIKASCLLMGARTLSGALVPLVGASPTNVNFVSGDYDRKTGLAGNGSTKYLNSNRANNADPQNSNHIAAYLSTASTIPDGNIWGTDGVGVAGGNNLFRLSVSPGTSLAGANRGTGSGSAFSISGEGATTGFKGYSRSASTGYTVRSGGADTAVTATSSSPTARTVFFYARNDATNPPLFVSNPRIAFYSIGEHLSLSLLDSRVSDLYTAIGNSTP